MSETEVISPENYSLLSAKGEAIKLHSGKVEVHRRAFRGSSDDDQKIIVPKILYSAETLQWCGFTAEMADNIFNVWNQPLERGPLGMNDYIRLNLERINAEANTDDDDDKWEQALTSMGIAAGLRRGIMDNEFREIRMSKSAKFWAIQFVTGAWDFLANCNTLINSRERWESSAISTSALACGSGNTASKLFPDASSTTSKPSNILQRGSGADRATRTPESLPSEAPTEQNMKLPVRLKTEKGEVEMWKGQTGSYLLAALEYEFIIAHKMLNFAAIMTESGGDFNAAGPVLYLTKERTTAFVYAAYMARAYYRGGQNIECGLLKFNVPENMQRGLLEIIGDEWKDLVWDSRSKLSFTPIVKKYTNTPVLFGQICNGTNDLVLQKGKHQMRFLRQPDGTPCTKHVFKLDRVMEMQQAMVNKVQYIKIEDTTSNIIQQAGLKL